MRCSTRDATLQAGQFRAPQLRGGESASRNLTLSGRHLFPNVVEIETHNLVCFSPYAAKAAGDASTHEFTFKFSELHADMRDMRDSGLADVVLGVGLELKFGVQDSKHKLLYKTLKLFRRDWLRARDSHLATQQFKKQAKKALETFSRGQE
ncbi:hypothetical protein B0H15DRAFT_798933 [Mycena belliarum]|uniref:HAM1-like N-terminal domain-containing protein n=1 Tax=Mycena belliarum TaxID=1033014 RepID=A0AAD6XUH8_9AGAR|nr:hypothetical protein B0H15DRAFT_798933 [Mycena belliae]